MQTLGLSMIAKNEAHTIQACLKSVSGIASQIVIADTGSTDATAEIAREFGATIISVPWRNHFAEARNAALEPMQTDWVLCLDADEELDGRARSKLRKLLAAPETDGYLVPIRNYVPVKSGRGWDSALEANDHKHPRAAGAPAYFVHENCRLFRRKPGIYFTGRVHELVEHQFKVLNLKMGRANFCIHHFGQMAGEASRKSKLAAYRDLLRLKAQEQPHDPLAWVQLGLAEYECCREAAEPLRCLDRAISLEPRMPQAWLFKGMIYVDAGNDQAALAALETTGAGGSSGALREHFRGDALHNLGRLEEARAAYAKAAELTHGDPVLNSKLGYTEVRSGRTKDGLSKLHQAAESAPALAEIRERLMKAYIVIDRLPEAAEQAEQLAALEGTARSYLRAASIRVHLKQAELAKQCLSNGLELFPESVELHRAWKELDGQLSTKASRAGM